MKEEQQINHRARLFHYYRYIIEKPDHDELYQPMRVLDPHQQRHLSPKKRRNNKEYEHKNHTIAEPISPIKHHSLRRNRSIRDKLDMILNEQTRSPNNIKLPPIRKSQGEGNQWKRYYNQHDLQTINIDSSTLKLIYQNQKKDRLKKRYSLLSTEF